MGSIKTIKDLIKAIFVDDELIEEFQGIAKFEDLSHFAIALGFDLSSQQLRTSAEIIVEKRRQDLEDAARFGVAAGHKKNPGLISRIFLKNKRSQDRWDDQMCKICYYVDDPNYDSFARMKEKGG